MRTREVPVWKTAVRARWQAFAPREQRALALAGALVLAALVWALLLAPAIRTLQKAQAQRIALDAQWDTMLRLQKQAQALQAQAAVSAPAAVSALQNSVAGWGAGAKLTVLGEQATLTLQRVSGDSLAQWLVQLGGVVRVQPAEVHLAMDAGPGPSTWSGTLRFDLPPAGAR